MPKIIALPDGNEAEFPDDMDDAAIAEVLSRQFPPEPPPPEPAPARFDPTRVAAGPGAIPHGVEVTPEQVATVGTIAAAPFAGTTGIAGAVGRAALSPVTAGLGAAAEALYHGRGPVAAVKHGVGAYLGGKVLGGAFGKAAEKVLKPIEKAKVAHAVKRSVREAVTETAAPAVTKAAAKAAAPVAPDVPVEDILSDMTKRVTSMHGLGIDPKDISKSLVKHYTATGRGAGLTAGKMRGLVDEIIKTTPKAETNLADEMASKVIGWAKGSGFSRAQMDDALRREYPVELTPAKAREVVDFILDSQKIGPQRTAAEMGVSLNQQIRDARAKVGAP